MMQFTAKLWYESEGEGWWVARCIEEPTVASQGKTEQEALANLKEALELYFDPEDENGSEIEVARVRRPIAPFSQRYLAYIRSDIWKERRKMRIKHALGECEKCHSPHGRHVHHLNYIRLGHELNEDLMVLCRLCHALCHAESHYYGGNYPEPSRD